MDESSMLNADRANKAGEGHLPGLLGLDFKEIGPGRAAAELTVEAHHKAPHGYLHAATVTALADTAAGYGTLASLPQGAQSFTTINLQCSFLGTAREGTIRTEATLRHGGRSTQVWDAEVVDSNGKTIAIFRCTQMILWPRGGDGRSAAVEPGPGHDS